MRDEADMDSCCTESTLSDTRTWSDGFNRNVVAAITAQRLKRQVVKNEAHPTLHSTLGLLRAITLKGGSYLNSPHPTPAHLRRLRISRGIPLHSLLPYSVTQLSFATHSQAGPDIALPSASPITLIHPSFNDNLRPISKALAYMGFNELFPSETVDHHAEIRVVGTRERRLPWPVVVMDGGMGTTLEDEFNQDISNSSLWSARLIKDDPQTLARAHLAFLRAGCRTLSSATYQCAFETFARAGYNTSDATALMRSAVRIADEARNSSYSSSITTATATPVPVNNGGTAKLVLALGPYGATLSPAQEFDGLYPPPFGPSGLHPPSMSPNIPITTAFDENCSSTSEEMAEAALQAFHYRRLRVYADDRETWSRIDIVAFETVPLLREAKAIQRAVGALVLEMHDAGQEGWTMKPWYISFVFPGGRFPQEESVGGPRISPTSIIRNLFSEGSAARPDGIGINCTEPRFLPTLMTEFEDAIRSSSIQLHPWLVLYPNGGEIYDIVKQTWSPPSDSRVGELSDSQDPADRWATDVFQALEPRDQEQLSTPVWAGILIGGCCKAGPEHIAALCRKLV